MKRLISLLLILIGPAVFSVNADDGEEAEFSSTEVEAALDDCAESVASDTSGQPDAQAMDSCMSGKGFSRPVGGSPPGMGGDDSDQGGESAGDQGGRPPPPPPPPRQSQ